MVVNGQPTTCQAETSPKAEGSGEGHHAGCWKLLAPGMSIHSSGTTCDVWCQVLFSFLHPFCRGAGVLL